MRPANLTFTALVGALTQMHAADHGNADDALSLEQRTSWLRSGGQGQRVGGVVYEVDPLSLRRCSSG